jgi:hypothetical protein
MTDENQALEQAKLREKDVAYSLDQAFQEYWRAVSELKNAVVSHLQIDEINPVDFQSVLGKLTTKVTQAFADVQYDLDRMAKKTYPAWYVSQNDRSGRATLVRTQRSPYNKPEWAYLLEDENETEEDKSLAGNYASSGRISRL